MFIHSFHVSLLSPIYETYRDIFLKIFFSLTMLCMSCLYKAGDGHTRFFCFILCSWHGTWLLLWFVIVNTKKSLRFRISILICLCLCYVIFMEVVFKSNLVKNCCLTTTKGLLGFFFKCKIIFILVSRIYYNEHWISFFQCSVIWYEKSCIIFVLVKYHHIPNVITSVIVIKREKYACDGTTKHKL